MSGGLIIYITHPFQWNVLMLRIRVQPLIVQFMLLLIYSDALMKHICKIYQLSLISIIQSQQKLWLLQECGCAFFLLILYSIIQSCVYLELDLGVNVIFQGDLACIQCNYSCYHWILIFHCEASCNHHILPSILVPLWRVNSTCWHFLQHWNGIYEATLNKSCACLH